MQAAKLNNLTVARFFAALLIVFHHAANVLQDPNVVSQAWLRMFFSNGYVGVTFFFILSGFVISASSLDKLRSPSFAAATTFFLRRLVRIVPVWLFLSLPFVLPDLLAGSMSLPLFQYLTFTQSWSADINVAHGYLAVAWTLSCEMFFYAMFPLTAFVIERLQTRIRHVGAILILVALLSPLCAYLLFVFVPSLASLDMMDPNGPHRWLCRNPAVRFSEFLLGIGLFICLRQYGDQLCRPRQSWVWRSALIVSMSMLVVLMSNLAVSAITLTLAYIVPFGLIVFSLAAIETGEEPISFRAPYLLLLGEGSYSLYLVHPFGLQLYAQISTPSVPQLGLTWAIVLTVAMSIGLFLLIEKPIRTLLNGYLERKNSRLATRFNAPVSGTSHDGV